MRIYTKYGDKGFTRLYGGEFQTTFLLFCVKERTVDDSGWLCVADENVLSSEGTKQSWFCRCLAYGSYETEMSAF